MNQALTGRTNALEMKPMDIGSGLGQVSPKTKLRYVQGGRAYDYEGPSGGSMGRLCELALSTCRVCGLSRPERQLWNKVLVGPIVNLVKVNVGGGILAIPLTFKLCGAVPASLMLVFFGSLSHCSSVILACVGEMTGSTTLEGASQVLLGYWGARVLQVSMLLKCFGSLVAYLIVMGNVIPPLLCEYALLPAEKGSESSQSLGFSACTVGAPWGGGGDVEVRTLTLLAIGAGILAPLSLLRSVNSLRFGSALCLVMVALVIIQIILTAFAVASDARALAAELALKAAKTAGQGGLAGVESSAPADSQWGEGWFHGVQGEGHTEALLRSLGILVFAFTCQHLVFPVYSELRGASTALFSLVSRLTFVTVALIYWTMGVAGFASFGAVSA
jgi:amino acid permease